MYASTVYNYTLQVFVGADIDSGMKIGISEIGRFMTSDAGDMGGDTCKKTCAFWSAFFPIKSCCYFSYIVITPTYLSSILSGTILPHEDYKVIINIIFDHFQTLWLKSNFLTWITIP